MALTTKGKTAIISTWLQARLTDAFAERIAGVTVEPLSDAEIVLDEKNFKFQTQARITNNHHRTGEVPDAIGELTGYYREDWVGGIDYLEVTGLKLSAIMVTVAPVDDNSLRWPASARI